MHTSRYLVANGHCLIKYFLLNLSRLPQMINLLHECIEGTEGIGRV